MKKVTRRGFIASAAFAAAGGSAAEANEATVPQDPFLGTRGQALEVGVPCLQAAGETTMGVSWAVSGLSKGEVEYADNPGMVNSMRQRCGGYGLVPIDTSALQVRLTGLRPSTRYWYRTITTPFTDYANIYDAKLGEPIVSDIHSFTTLGCGVKSHFCMICDTHAQWKSYQLISAKLKELSPAAVVWNGDATNTTQKKSTAVKIFLNPPITDSDWMSDIPMMFESGNHDFRGSWISRKEEVVLPRDPAERSSGQWDLKWNFAVRIGDIAAIGMDTGEDKPDSHPKWFGLANFTPYRQAQAKWLEDQLSRPDIASAKHKILFCHIPLFAAQDSAAYPHDGVAVDPHDFAHWSRECSELWGPLIDRCGINLVVCGHQHRFRYDPPSQGRKWAQVVGGGPNLASKDKSLFPTVVEGFVEDSGGMRLRVHNVESGVVALDTVLL